MRPTQPSARDCDPLSEAVLFRKGTFTDDEKERLAHNAVFLLLVKRQAAESTGRLVLICTFTFGFFVLTGVYFRYVFRWDASLALLASCAVGVSFTLVLGFLFIFGGISGYESMLQIVRNARDIIPTPIAPDEIALAVWAATARLYHPLRDRFLFAGGAGALVIFLALFREGGGPFIFCWMLLPSAAFGLLLAASAGAFPSVGLPGSLLWISGVARGSRRRISANPGRARSTISRTARNLIALGAVLGVVAVLGGYMRIGLWVEQSLPLVPALSEALSALAAGLAGLVVCLGVPVGIAVFRLTRSKKKYLKSIADRIEQTLDALRIRQNEFTSES